MKEESNLKRKRIDPEIFLTFDDGPNEPYTSQILDILKDFGAKASFFVCGRCVEHSPGVVQRILNEGHSIGNHSYSHSMVLTFMGFLRREIEETDNIIQKITGVRTNLFRSPWGMTTPWIKSYLKKNKYKIVSWDINSYDWAGVSARTIEDGILKKIKSGSVVLLHDGKEAKFHRNRSQTVLALPPLLENLISRGFICKNISL
ncbi:Peptidoglycan-N-acetylglucosamine deacetylase [Candidatus Brocadiaceae bacterium B188]|nr:polysaccharide deacetylase family protein [Candidatus Brocadia sapporoensis]QQR66154.1 MAG: polysaccharide deacetylase family protein [Candidatus Brocadia sp.]RZV56540.1 MAG: polysaccharide deacetylase family protein [Candidatus Brocadia sp. BROELEC01]TWU53084.1 Peptidoglycan-N-acetylglucosamine deacetylase [Candidatus Brocadiaceae bacterium B188]